jgi:hypothetical protein
LKLYLKGLEKMFEYLKKVKLKINKKLCLNSQNKKKIEKLKKKKWGCSKTTPRSRPPLNLMG